MSGNGIVGMSIEFDGQHWEGIAFPVPVTASRIGDVIANHIAVAAAGDRRVTRIEFSFSDDVEG